MSQELEDVQYAAEQKEAELQKSLDQAQNKVRPRSCVDSSKVQRKVLCLGPHVEPCHLPPHSAAAMLPLALL